MRLKNRPEDWIEKPLQDEKLLIWCAISVKRIFGPFYFNQTVNQHNYLDMLKSFFGLRYYERKATKTTTSNKMVQLRTLPISFKVG